MTLSSSQLAVVVGGAGFVGSHVADALDRLTGTAAVEILVVGRTPPSDELPGKFVAGDRKDPEFIGDLVRELRPRFWFDLALFDAEAMEALVDAYLRHPSLEGVVVGGTIAEYGPGRDLPLPLPEDIPLHPEGRYGRGKVAAWDLASRAFEQHGFPVVWAVLPQLWGPRDPHGRDCSFVQELLAGRTITLRGNGRTVLPDGYVETAAAALVHLGLQPDLAGCRVNVCGRSPVTPLRYIQWAARALAVEPKVAHVDHREMQKAEASTGHRYRPVFGDYDLTLDSGRLTRTGFPQTVSAEEGVRRTALWHRDNKSAPASDFAQWIIPPLGDAT